jgi:hypothetical protein
MDLLYTLSLLAVVAAGILQAVVLCFLARLLREMQKTSHAALLVAELTLAMVRGDAPPKDATQERPPGLNR